MDKYSTLDAIARQLITEQAQPDERRYYPYLAYGYAFLNGEYPTGSGGGNPLKTVLLEVGADRTADLPTDYIELVSLGRICGDKVRNLAYNANLVPATLAVAPGTGIDGYGNLACAVGAAWPAFEYWGYDGLLPGWDGLGYGWGEWRDEFVIDPQEGTIRLSTLLGGMEAGPLVLQYHSNDQKPGAPTPIHPYWQMALKEFMLWQWYDKAKENPQMAARHEAQYYKQRSKALSRTDPTSLYDVRAILYQNYNSLR